MCCFSILFQLSDGSRNSVLRSEASGITRPAKGTQQILGRAVSGYYCLHSILLESINATDFKMRLPPIILPLISSTSELAISLVLGLVGKVRLCVLNTAIGCKCRLQVLDSNLSCTNDLLWCLARSDVTCVRLQAH